jgi:uncharacterized protein (DUF1810 family)
VKSNLSRFLEAQSDVYFNALEEVKRGKKTSHWMWYIFPQIRGLGLSETSIFFSLQNLFEAEEYYNHEILGRRLLEISGVLLNIPENNAVEIFGDIDSLKLKSSMTLFSLLDNTDPVFQRVLDKFYGGKKDDVTIRLLNENH